MKYQKPFVFLSLRGVFPNRERLRRSNPSLKNLSLVFFFCVFPSFLLADPPIVDPVSNTLTVESAANTTSAEVLPPITEMVVTADRLDVPVSQVTDSMTVITAKDIEKKQSGTILNAIENVPGLEMAQNGNPGENSTVYIRGNDPQHTLVLMDGVPLNDPVGVPFDYEYLDGLTSEDVEQIEVVRGPQSTLWGSSAIGGVINIIPQSGPAPLGGSAMFESGSYGTSREMVSAQGGDLGGYFNFDASHFDSAGFPALSVKGLDASDAAFESSTAGSVANGDDNNTISLRFGSDLASNLEEKVFVRYSQSNTSLDTYNTALFDGGNALAYYLADDPGYFSLQKQFMADSHTKWKLLDGIWDQDLSIAFSDDNRIYTATPNPYSTYFANGNYDGQTAQISWQNNIHLLNEETIVLGVQGQEQWATAANASGYTDLTFLDATDNIPVTSVQTGSAFIESLTSIDDRLFLNLGWRWEDHSQFGVHTTYQAGLAYFIPGTDTKISANYGTGFLAPSLYQLYDPQYGNPNLKPETSLGYDFGFEQPLGGKNFLKVGADYFDSDLTNLIEPGPAPYYIPGNIGQARTYGVESFVEFHGIQNLSMKGDYTYTYAWDLTNNVALIRRPQNKAGGDMDYQMGKAGFGASVVYVGQNLDDDFGNTLVNASTGQTATTVVTLPSYFLVNLRASFQLDPNVKLFVRVDNLFNQYYEELYGYSTPGLSVYGGTRVSL